MVEQVDLGEHGRQLRPVGDEPVVGRTITCDLSQKVEVGLAVERDGLCDLDQLRLACADGLAICAEQFDVRSHDGPFCLANVTSIFYHFTAENANSL